MEDLIQKTYVDRKHLPDLAKQLTMQDVVIIAKLDAAESTSIRIQDFMNNEGRAFIPIFSDATHFEQEIAGTGFEKDGVSIDGNLLAYLLRGDETLILNAGGATPIELSAADLKQHVDPSRLPA